MAAIDTYSQRYLPRLLSPVHQDTGRGQQGETAAPETFKDKKQSSCWFKDDAKLKDATQQAIGFHNSPIALAVKITRIPRPHIYLPWRQLSQLTERLTMSSCTSRIKVDNRLHHHCNLGTVHPMAQLMLSPPSLLVLPSSFSHCLTPIRCTVTYTIHTPTLMSRRKRASHTDNYYLVLTTIDPLQQGHHHTLNFLHWSYRHEA